MADVVRTELDFIFTQIKMAAADRPRVRAGVENLISGFIQTGGERIDFIGHPAGAASKASGRAVAPTGYPARAGGVARDTFMHAGTVTPGTADCEFV